MKLFFRFALTNFLFLFVYSSTLSSPLAGFHLPDSVCHLTLSYQSIQNLIILPVTINGNIKVNLILDTGCRNLVLFGKRFKRLLTIQPEKWVQFSGLGSGDPVYGALSIENKVSINAVLGEKIPVVIVPDENLFKNYPNVHGVIGYDIFLKFEIEINPFKKLITFRPAMSATLPSTYTAIPLNIEDSRPILTSDIILQDTKIQRYKLMIDTGSTLGLLLKTTDLKSYPTTKQSIILGRGFNGMIEGVRTVAKKLVVGKLEITDLETGIMHSPWHNYASIGMGALKDYSLILNYCKAYAGLRKINAVDI